MEAAAKRKKYTYADYLQFPDEPRVELIEGEIYAMPPGPSVDQFRIQRAIFRQVEDALKESQCEVFHAPPDVILDAGDAASGRPGVVVQPGIFVVCDESKIQQRGCFGPPDLIVEVTSPSNACHDHIVKLDLSERYGVGEYWIVGQGDRILLRRALGDDGAYGKPQAFDREGVVESVAIAGVTVELGTVFAVDQ